MNTYRVRLTLETEMLGTVSKSPDIFEQHQLSKAGNEITPEQAEEEKSTSPVDSSPLGYTGFHHNEDGQPLIYDFVIRGYLKAAAGVMKKVPNSLTSKEKAHLKLVNNFVFVTPRQLVLQLPEEATGELDTLSRPLRAQTMQGERIALVKSDIVPAGTVIEFEVHVLANCSEALLREWLDYGRWSGLGQWRNAGHGRFTYTLETVAADS